jgi:hypothetical protein
MTTRSGHPYRGNRLSQQQHDDLLIGLVNQVDSISKRMEIIWDHVFEKLESSGEKTKREETEEGKLKEVDDNREKPNGSEDHPQYTTPGYNSRNQPLYPRYDYTPHTQFPLHLFPERMDNS